MKSDWITTTRNRQKKYNSSGSADSSALRQTLKPVIIHSREACQDTLACMRAEHAEQIGGVIHCYSYSKEAAQEFLKWAFTGFGGVVTFKNAKRQSKQ